MAVDDVLVVLDGDGGWWWLLVVLVVVGSCCCWLLLLISCLFSLMVAIATILSRSAVPAVARARDATSDPTMLVLQPYPLFLVNTITISFISC